MMRKLTPDTISETYNLWKTKKSVTQIAKIRNLKEATIESHLARLYANEKIDIKEIMEKVIDEETFIKIKTVIKRLGTKKLSAIKDCLPDASYGMINIVLAIMAKQHKTKPEKHICSVSEITHKIKSSMETNFPEVWVEGEISSLAAPSSGHIYFTLKDEKCQIKAVLFRYITSRISFTPQSGQKVIVFGEISVYEKRGEYQIVVQEINLAGRGDLFLAFEKLKEKLQKEGLFDKKYKKPIPVLIQKIGIITSPTGAAIQDILSIIEKSFAPFEVLINPVHVQGNLAAPEISQAIKEMNEIPNLDVLIISRGGGSIEDLWAFNEEEVAWAIFNSKIPVISAVGHEIDYTIADFVADFRALTPSAAAEEVVGRKEEIINQLERTKTRLQNGIRNRLKLSYSQLEGIRKSTPFARPLDRIYQYFQHVDNLLSRIAIGTKRSFQDYQRNLSAAVSRLNALNPIAILSRGYSICYKMPGKVIIKDASKVKIKDILQIRLHKGRIVCEVEETRK